MEFVKENSGRGVLSRGFIILLVATTFLSACGKNSSQPGEAQGDRGNQANGAPRQLKKGDLTKAEQMYGLSPVPDPSVTYQPDVVMVGGGAEAIRELSANGLTWTIDARAARADELVPGKIFFMTGRAVGRVLDVRHDGANLLVTVGPVSLTELIQQAHIHIDAMPIDFGEALAFTSPELPGAVLPLSRTVSGAASTPARFGENAGWRLYKTSTTPADAGVPPATRSYSADNFVVTPNVSPTTIGVNVKADDDGFKLTAQAALHLRSPTLSVEILITPKGGVEKALLVLTGGAGLTWNFNMGSEKTMRTAIDAILQPNTDFSIPLTVIGGIPLAVTVRQKFIIKTGLEVKNSTLSATGSYTFHGALKVGYQNKYWVPEPPQDYLTDTSMTKTAAGVSLGLQGLNLAEQVRVYVGLGVHGFATGPYLSYNSAIGVVKSSSIGMIECNQATLRVTLTGGVGYVIPKGITDLINSVLRALNIKYQITGEGGVEPSRPSTVVEKTSQLGGCAIDKNSPATGTIKGGP